MSKTLFQAAERITRQLTWAEQRRLVRKLNQPYWGQRLAALLKRIDERQQRLPPLSMKEIVQEVKAVRRRRASRRRA